MKLCILKSHMTHVFTKFHGFEFSFRFYRHLGTCSHAPFLNDPVVANQSTIIIIFLIIIDLESPENCSVVV